MIVFLAEEVIGILYWILPYSKQPYPALHFLAFRIYLLPSPIRAYSLPLKGPGVRCCARGFHEITIDEYITRFDKVL